ncbi:MAG: hypothetical protein WA485_08485 [Candidatus Sulfotelmatobacter sp.]
MKRIAKYALLTLSGLVIGFPLGFWHAQRSMGDGAVIFSQTLALSEYETLANLQYRQADANHAVQAQLDLLSFMQQLQSKQKIAVHRSFDYDQARVLMRLALLEERAGYGEGFQRRLRQAQECLNRSDHKWYSEEQMRKFIAKADTTSEY